MCYNLCRSLYRKFFEKECKNKQMSSVLGSCTDLIPNLIWIVPIAGGALSVLGARAGGAVRNAIAVGSGLVTALLATSLFFISDFSSYTLTGKIYDDFTLCGSQATWIQALGLNAGVLVDPLTAVLAVTISWVSFLILYYSLGYMKGEKNLTRYYFLMTFFIGNMLLLVMSDNFLQLFLGWEGVGYCSYALIGFWHTDESKYWVGTLGEKTAGVPESYSPSQAGLGVHYDTSWGYRISCGDSNNLRLFRYVQFRPTFEGPNWTCRGRLGKKPLKCWIFCAQFYSIFWWCYRQVCAVPAA